MKIPHHSPCSSFSSLSQRSGSTFVTLFLLLASVLLVSCASQNVTEQSSQGSSPQPEDSLARTLVTELDIPWEIAFLPEGDLLVTERSGQLVRIGSRNETFVIDGVHHRGEGGLLGLALHPDFTENNYVYLYLTTREDGKTINRVERYRLDLVRNVLENQFVVIDSIPGASYHDGGRIAFGPDGYLYITTGDAGDEDSAQSVMSLAGKILRVDDSGGIPSDNPFRNAIYSYGHRNPQGLTWDDSGRLWSTEHGRSGFVSGYDELNLIVSGGNYGWPVIQGDEEEAGMISPVIHSGSDTTWAPADAAYSNGKIFFTGLRGESLYVYDITVEQLSELFSKNYGRLRVAAVSPDGLLYMSTSNRDGRGTVRDGDDRIIVVQI